MLVSALHWTPADSGEGPEQGRGQVPGHHPGRQSPNVVGCGTDDQVDPAVSFSRRDKDGHGRVAADRTRPRCSNGMKPTNSGHRDKGQEKASLDKEILKQADVSS